MSFVQLESPFLSVSVDPGRGSDILSVVDRASGTELLFSTPWREAADNIRAGRASATSTGSMETWLEQYRGGWQTLCPNAGAPRVHHGAPFGYHGEASIATWRIVDQHNDSVRLATSLFSIPVSIEREIVVNERSLTVTDTVTNLSSHELNFDYAHHPAFGGAFLDGECVIETGAQTFVNDPEAGIEGVEPGSRHAWPHVARQNGEVIDLETIPQGVNERSIMGWLADFTDHWASVTNRELGLTARLEWDGTHLPYAWFWQELNSEAGWPWYGRTRAIAIEPSSTTTSGPERKSVIQLGPNAQLTVPITLTVS